MKPTVGRIVIYRVQESEVATNSGSTVAPAVVVRVWGDAEDALVNLKVLFDGSEIGWRTSVPFAGTDTNEGHAKPFSWYWPTRD